MIGAGRSAGATLRRALVSGSVAGLVSTVALWRRGRRDTGDPVTPLNGPSQWLLGKHASYQDGFRLPHTLLGLGIHHAMSIFWALPFEHFGGGRHPARPLAAAIVPASVTAATACFVDFRLTPERFTPGFERRLSRASLAVVYGAFALGLVLGRVLNEGLAASRDRRPGAAGTAPMARGLHQPGSLLPVASARSGSERFIQGEKQS